MAYHPHVAKSWKSIASRGRIEVYRDHVRRLEYGDSNVRKYVGGLGRLFRWGQYSCDPSLTTASPVEGVK